MKIIAAFAASAVASLALLAAPPAAAQKSTAFQIDPTHAGSTVFPGGLRLPLEIAWSRKWPVPHGNFNEVSYPLIVDGRVFFTVTPFGTQKHGAQMIGTLIYGLSLQDGRLLWKKHLPDDYHWSALAYDNGRLFVTAGDGIVAALDPDTGRPIWRRRIRDPNTWSLVSPPTAADGRIFFSGSGNQGTLFALDQATGTELWKSRVKGSASGAATVVGDSVFVAYSDHVYRFDTATGATRWYFN